MPSPVNNVHSATGAGANKHDAGAGNTFGAFSMFVASPSPTTVTVLETSPDNTTYTAQGSVTGSGWGTARSDDRQRYARSNCTTLGGAGTLASATVMAMP